jgi:hypothetical protein
MRYARPEQETELQRITHPELYALMVEFEKWSRENDLPEPKINGLGRTLSWYAKNGLKPNPHSWHLFDCAIDLDNTIYSLTQLAQVEMWLKARCQMPKYELIFKLHGTGPHIHIGRRDFNWKSTGTRKPAEKPGKLPA